MMRVPSPIDRINAIMAVLRKRCYTATEKNVATYLLGCQNSKDGRCFPSYGTIAKDLDIDRGTAIRAVRAIEAEGDVEVCRTIADDRWSSNQFNFAFDRLLAETEKTEPATPEFSHPPSGAGDTTPPSPSGAGDTPPSGAGDTPLMALATPKQGKKNKKTGTQESLAFGEANSAKAKEAAIRRWVETDWWPKYPPPQEFPNRWHNEERATKLATRIILNGKTTQDELMDGILRYRGTEKVRRGAIMNPVNWLNGRCWSGAVAPQLDLRPAANSMLEAVLRTAGSRG